MGVTDLGLSPYSFPYLNIVLRLGIELAACLSASGSPAQVGKIFFFVVVNVHKLDPFCLRLRRSRLLFGAGQKCKSDDKSTLNFNLISHLKILSKCRDL